MVRLEDIAPLSDPSKVPAQLGIGLDEETRTGYSQFTYAATDAPSTVQYDNEPKEAFGTIEWRRIIQVPGELAKMQMLST